MADIELVIKIPEEKYNYVIKQVAERIDNPLKLYIANGTPLPKGHGRLIDADRLWDSYHDLGYDFYEAFDLAETIIEADTESEVNT